eukprot:Awhi_evm1s10653
MELDVKPAKENDDELTQPQTYGKVNDNGLSDENVSFGESIVLAEAQEEIVAFGPKPFLNFQDGNLFLSMRIKCYCRHHHEKVGFRVNFSLTNSQGQVVCSALSPSIMISDEKKSLYNPASVSSSSLSLSMTSRSATSSSLSTINGTTKSVSSLTSLSGPLTRSVSLP